MCDGEFSVTQLDYWFAAITANTDQTYGCLLHDDGLDGEILHVDVFRVGI